MGTLFFAQKIAAYLESMNAFDFIDSIASDDIQKHLEKTYGIELNVNEIENIIDMHSFISLSNGIKARFIKSYNFYYLKTKERRL